MTFRPRREISDRERGKRENFQIVCSDLRMIAVSNSPRSLG
jgi:hypothetical protein